MYASFKKRGNIYQINIRIKERVDGKSVDIVNERVLSIEVKELQGMTLDEFRDYLNDFADEIDQRLEVINQKVESKRGTNEKYHIPSLECRFAIYKQYHRILKRSEKAK